MISVLKRQKLTCPLAGVWGMSSYLSWIRSWKLGNAGAPQDLSTLSIPHLKTALSGSPGSSCVSYPGFNSPLCPLPQSIPPALTRSREATDANSDGILWHAWQTSLTTRSFVLHKPSKQMVTTFKYQPGLYLYVGSTGTDLKSPLSLNSLSPVVTVALG